MDYRSLIGNMSVAFVSQGVAMCLSVITSLFVPKVLGVEEFGYWQLFLLYASYAGFFHFGINDGVYLVNGGKSREDLDRGSVSSQLYVTTVMQLTIAMALVAVAASGGFGEERCFVIAATAVYMLVNNAASYLGFVFQAVNETKLFSFSIMVDRLVFLVPLVVLLVFRLDQFEPYVISYCLAKAAALLFCVWKGWDILVRPLSLDESVRDALRSLRIGIKLMLANVASMLILGIMRMAVDAVWGIEAFGEVSFSLTMVNFFLVFVAQASMVLFPALRRAEPSELRSFFRKIRDGLGLLLPSLFILYFPMKWALGAWLPQYEASMGFFALLLPICLFDGRMNLVGTTFFNVLRWEGRLLSVNAIAVAASLVASALGAYVLGSIEFMLVAVVLVIMARSIVSEYLVSREFGCVDFRIPLGEVVVTVLFLFLTHALGDLWALLGYAVVYALYLLANRKPVGVLLDGVKRVCTR